MQGRGLAPAAKGSGPTRLSVEGLVHVPFPCSRSGAGAGFPPLSFAGSREAISTRKPRRASFLSHQPLRRPGQPGLDLWGLQFLGCGQETSRPPWG